MDRRTGTSTAGDRLRLASDSEQGLRAGRVAAAASPVAIESRARMGRPSLGSEASSESMDGPTGSKENVFLRQFVFDFEDFRGWRRGLGVLSAMSEANRTTEL